MTGMGDGTGERPHLRSASAGWDASAPPFRRFSLANTNQLPSAYDEIGDKLDELVFGKNNNTSGPPSS